MAGEEEARLGSGPSCGLTGQRGFNSDPGECGQRRLKGPTRLPPVFVSGMQSAETGLWPTRPLGPELGRFLPPYPPDSAQTLLTHIPGSISVFSLVVKRELRTSAPRGDGLVGGKGLRVLRGNVASLPAALPKPLL